MWRRRFGALLLRPQSSTPVPSSSSVHRHFPLPVSHEVPYHLPSLFAFFLVPMRLFNCFFCAEASRLEYSTQPLHVSSCEFLLPPHVSIIVCYSCIAAYFFTSQPVSFFLKGGDAVKPFIAFVLGGPGSGKGTQCARIASDFGFAHLSAGDLLRNEISSGSEKGELILDIIKEGRIVPSDITIDLIRKAMESTNAKKVLIDGFPRCEENRIAFERIIGTEPDLVIFFDCPEDEMVKRLLSRNQGRVDDNIETIKKRLKVFESLNIPVVDYYSSRGKVHKINAMGTPEEIFGAVCKLFSSIRL
ncbi:hypothetical protein GUJ93_ZPchr0006g45457 [Zizania palustris]|uniref:UMP-CMP kinase n=1 Tax=Zizania palustris TaxID=103762 RepID=A0A8J5W350_ZIZPA|nr:hypothetical protein GUJ93_ZPchr0006g45457 [Zizania palustris]